MTAATTTTDQLTGVWEIDPDHSEVGFTVRHLMNKVRGNFTEFAGQAEITTDPTRSTVTAEIRTASVDTRNEQRDGHLRSPEILNVDRYPTMTFRATEVRPNDAGDYTVHGDLTITDVTRPVTLAVEFLGVGTDPWGGTRAGFFARTAISRRDFGIDFNIPFDGDRLLLSDKVEIQLEIQLVRKN